MTQKSRDFQQFWHELKRRKVFKVVAMYAGTAFIILQLVDIIAQPLQLPAWTITLVIVLLCIGFIITLLISWIYDITPEGIKRTESIETVKKKKPNLVPVKRGFKASNIIIAAMAVVIVILLYPKVFKHDTLEKIRSSGQISVVIMPFQNMTNDTTWNIWQNGIQNELITHLTNSEELKVRQTESINTLIQSKGFTNYASITPSVASKISQKLDANIFIYGSIKQVGTILRLNAQLIDSKTQDAFKSFQIDGKAENILHVIDSLSVMVKNFLIISKLKKEETSDIQNIVSTNSPEAYRYFISGLNAFNERDYRTAIKMYLQAIAIDSNLTVAPIMLSLANLNLGLDQEARKWCLNAYKKKDLMPIQQKLFTNWAYALYFETPYEQIKYIKQSLEIDDQSPINFWQLGNAYSALYQFDKAIHAYKKALELYNKWDSKPMWVFNYINLGIAYHKTGQYREEKKLYKKAENDFPDDQVLIFRQATLSLTEGDTVAANDYIKTYISLSKERSSSDASISNNLAIMYGEAGIMNKAEEYYRKALSLEPTNPARMNNLAWFLIDKDRNVVEGLKLIDKVLELSPDTWYMLDTKGWGLYKQDKYQEALVLLEKAWNLKPIYDHELFLHLEAAKKAVANKKDN